MSLTVALSDLTLAWRKAKVDLYYSTNPPLFEMAEYEADLIANLQCLQAKLNGADEMWVEDSGFLGTWTLAPKAITPWEGKQSKDQQSKAKQGATLIFADPAEEWASMTADPAKPPTAEFRLMASCSLGLHVLSALWIQEIGHRFDRLLGDNVYGSRLCRNAKHEFNSMALGSFKPYLKPYRDWRDGAIKAMRSALEDKKRVIALTADVTSFYHELNPGFMLDTAFLELAGVQLSDTEEKLHRLFIRALQAWALNTPLKKGLPVGLPASAVVANAALIQLDQFIQRQVVPLYYGRYVDDILLVMENTSNLQNSEEFWKWIIDRDGGKGPLKQRNGSLLFEPWYLKGSRIAFENSKNKLFVLSGGPGKALVNAISEQIDQRASEWRALPALPDNPGTIATNLFKATNHSGEQADNLSKTDALSLHRADFALNLRDYEAYERDLAPEAWQAHRHAFFDAVIDHLLTPKIFFEQAQYLPRIVRIATACEDFEKLGSILRKLKWLSEQIDDNCIIEIKGLTPPDDNQNISIQGWTSDLNRNLAENVISALPCCPSTKARVDWCRYIPGEWLGELDIIWLGHSWDGLLSSPLNELIKLQQRLFSHDLAHTPLRFSGLPKEMVSQRGIPTPRNLVAATWQASEAPSGQTITTLASWFKPKLVKGIPPGLYFATRPFNLHELYLLAPSPFNTATLPCLSDVIFALRGADTAMDKIPRWDKHQRILEIPDGEPKPKQTIAVSSWETCDTSFTAAVMRRPDPSAFARYQRLNRLINELIDRPDQAGYLILPELAMPPQWFMRIAEKLKGRGISLITGVEYLHARKKKVRNQVWASLTHDGLGFPSLLIYRQDKQVPAPHERVELDKLGGFKMIPEVPWKNPPIIKHGNFRFALMICSELTNIRYRGDLRGRVDALFVPEWNQDTDTFSSLIESAALDIHAYIIQSNNRKYGDSRIRAPYKNRWKRDLLRVKGGNHDYCITGEIDVLALRQFQSCHRSPSEGFKPVPDGFAADMSKDRKVLPKGGA